MLRTKYISMIVEENSDEEEGSKIISGAGSNKKSTHSKVASGQEKHDSGNTAKPKMSPNKNFFLQVSNVLVKIGPEEKKRERSLEKGETSVHLSEGI